MRSALGICALFCLALFAFGVHLLREEQRRVTAFAAQTTATVVEKRRETSQWEDFDRTITCKPVVKFRYEVGGKQFTTDRVFPYAFEVTGNLGYDFVRTTLDRFEVGQQTTAHYNPENPAEACLIRRPNVILYLAVLGPAILAIILGVTACFWRPSGPGAPEFRRRKARWIAGPWHLVGLASGVHYFHLAGADYSSAALWLFGLYTQLGLIPVAIALPSGETSELARRVKDAIVVSICGTCAGFFLGGFSGVLAAFVFRQGPLFVLAWMGYAGVLGAALGAVLGSLTTRPGSTPVRVEAVAEKAVPRAEHTRPRIVEDALECRIIFPNTVESRSFSGTGSVLWGLGLLAIPLCVLLRWVTQEESWGPPGLPLPALLFVVAFFSLWALLSLAELLKGLTRLLGRRELRINPQTITYRTTLLGLGVPFALRTAEVISVEQSVIRTAQRELRYSEALWGIPTEERLWIIEEVSRRIDAARSANVS